VSMIIPDRRPAEADGTRASPDEFDAHAGGHPVPPMPHEQGARSVAHPPRAPDSSTEERTNA
jgi:hypothetical protein